MAIINLSNTSKIDYLPSYYKDNILIKPIYRNYNSIGIGKPTLNTSTFILDYQPLPDYQISLIQRTGSTSSNPLWSYVTYDANGDVFTNYESIDYEIYFTLKTYDASTETYFSTTTYLQEDMLINGVMPMSFPLTMSNGNITKTFTSVTIGELEIGYVMKESAVHSYMNELINYQYESGYNQGFFDATSENSTPINNGIGVMSTLFDNMSGLLGHEVIPNVTIGGLISIPLVISIVAVIFKLIK